MILAVRVYSLLKPAGYYLATSGGEPVSIYNVLKLQRGMVLYEDPREPPYYPTTLYNAGFYHFYAVTTWPLRHDFRTVLSVMRIITLGLSGVGLIALIVYATSHWNRRNPGKYPRLVALLMTLAAVTALYGPLTGWWVITVRPDIGAAAFAGIGLLIALGDRKEKQWGRVLLVGVCLAAAWSFKQSCVLIALGLLLCNIARRRYISAGLLMVPGCVAMFYLLSSMGPAYLLNVVWATSLSSLAWSNLGQMVVMVPVKGTFPLALAMACLVGLHRIDWVYPAERSTLLICGSTTLLGGIVSCCRTGSETNYFFELWIVVTLLAILGAKILVSSVEIGGQLSFSRHAPLLILLIISFGTAFVDLVRLTSIGGRDVGCVSLVLDAGKALELKKAGTLVRSIGRSVYCQPALSGLAWGPAFPAPIFDDYVYFHRPAARRNLLHGSGLEGLLAERFFKMVVLENTNKEILTAAVAAGYVKQPGWNYLTVLNRPNTVSESNSTRELVLSAHVY
jgi:hypothetical protein